MRPSDASEKKEPLIKDDKNKKENKEKEETAEE